MNNTRSPCVAFVVQRCGTDVYGGAEQYILKLARACAAAGARVEIFTSQSNSYLAWNNVLPEQEVIANDSESKIVIRRFPVVFSRLRVAFAVVRRIKTTFNSALQIFALQQFTDLLFLLTQGPWCPELWKTLAKENSRFDLVVCAGYLYAPTARSLALLPPGQKTVLIPMAHDEPEFFFPFVGRAIQASKILGFLSLAEQQLVEKAWGEAKFKTTTLIPPGLSVSENESGKNFERFSYLPERYLIYVGRVDIHKGVDFLLENVPPDVPLVLAGENHTCYSTSDNRYFLGRVSDSERDGLIKNAAGLVIASRFESYSMVTADALALGTIVLAREGCEPIDELIVNYGGISSSAQDFSEWARKLYAGDLLADRLLPKSAKIQTERSWAESAKKLLSFASN